MREEREPIEPPKVGDLLTDAQRKFIDRLIADTATDVAQLLAYFGFDSLDSIPKSEVNRVIKALESKRRAA